ncbi:MAG TPA: ABC transporter ATP-binding protein [Methylomirabilota bacterium]|jgi:spermidine/putrescine ABC transporter ATP-binding subunit|nr:ABC transporter ATP-binding protein [Methylomirabilota bacterium]
MDVELRGITKRYGPVRALDDFSLQVAPGEFFTLLGPSGCGKTTALRSIAGFVAPDAGEVFIKGHRVTGVPPHRRRVGMVFQHYALFPHRTVAQNIAFGLRMQRVPRADITRRVDDALALVQLPAHGARFPRQLSGGEQQRVALARAVVTHPTVLLLDEPLGALDKKLRERMQIELKRLQREIGITTIYVTHDQEEALTMSDRIAVMRDGRIEQIGNPLEIYEHPRSAFVADFIGTTNLVRGRLVHHDGRLATVECRGAKLRVADRAPGEAGEVVIAVRPEKLELDAAPPLDNTLSASITQLVYMGDTIVYTLRTDEGLELQSSELSRSGGVRYTVGARVTLGFRADTATLLRN